MLQFAEEIVKGTGDMSQLQAFQEFFITIMWLKMLV
jgi:hypothetical protein